MDFGSRQGKMCSIGHLQLQTPSLRVFFLPENKIISRAKVSNCFLMGYE